MYDAEAASRAGGRRRYNRARQIRRELRWGQVVKLLKWSRWPHRGWAAKIAGKLGVHRGTILRDMRAMQAATREAQRRAMEEIAARYPGDPTAQACAWHARRRKLF